MLPIRRMVFVMCVARMGDAASLRAQAVEHYPPLAPESLLNSHAVQVSVAPHYDDRSIGPALTHVALYGSDVSAIPSG